MIRSLVLIGLAVVLLLACTDGGDDVATSSATSNSSATATSPATATSSAAATPPIGTSRPGDLFWKLRPRGIFADERVAAAFGDLVNGKAVIESAGIDDSVVLHYAGPLTTDDLTEIGGRELLLAAGIDVESDPLVATRACTIWTPGPEPRDADRDAVAVALGARLAAVLKDLGTPIEPCTLIETADADILLWHYGYESAAVVPRPEPDVPAFIER